MQQRGQLNVKVFYTWGEEASQKYDPGFGKTISWDIPLLDGYPYAWVQNTAAVKGSHHFKGIQNPDLVRQLVAWQPEAILVYGWAYPSHLKVLRHFKGKLPLYFRGDSTLLNETTSLKRLLKILFLKWVYKNVDHAFYAGTNNKHYFKKFGLKDEQLTLAPHAIDNNRYAKNRTIEIKRLRDSLNIGDQDILILYAGKFEAVKNLELLLKVFIELNRPGTHLLFTGNGKEEVQLKKKAEQSTSAANIHFLDFQNQSFMPVLHQAADLFCLPSISETWGLSVNEAMACSKPILVSDKVGCAVDLVKSECNGAIFKSGSSDSMTLHLTALLDKGKEGLAQMGLLSKKIIDDWSIPVQVEAIESAVLKHG
ncbi:glycosyl transferase group 1 [Pedobacter heparinus DSM 2366]|uniref:Glycosyl transferase group 1 n=2 Tax=Pedobacter heparinus TaxID=984 RepID=C6XVM1_PEDHD|nr:glycosyl transferase group 1 [Pedobacter heparinus DSM 2366]